MKKKTKDVKVVVARYEYGDSYEELEAEVDQLHEDLATANQQMNEAYIWKELINDRVKYLEGILAEEESNGVGDD